MREIPLCRSCNEPHYNFLPCAKRDAEREEKKKREGFVYRAFTAPPGFRVWQSKPGEGNVIHAGSLFRARKAAPRGGVTPPNVAS